MAEAGARDERPHHPDPMNVAPVFTELTKEMLNNPRELAEKSLELWGQQAELWRRTMMGWMGAEEAEPLAEPERGDKRFADREWSENQVFNYMKQAYLLSSRWTQDLAHNIGQMPERDRRKLDFHMRNVVEAMSPSNFAATNPEVLRATIAEKGANLVRGAEALSRDIARGKGKLLISQTDMNAFKVGENMALTEGAVIWQDNVLQLIQYAPKTKTVWSRPLLFVPPWINKYYVLDLNPKKSMMQWLVEQGHQVFIISWVNPGPEQKGETWDSYMTAIMTALDKVREETGQSQVNIGSYCIGATMTAVMLAHMARTGDERVASATMFTGQMEFSSAGDLQALVDEKTLEIVDEQMEEGYLPADTMASAFNMLRSSDLIWSYVVQNYMLGKDPFPFDLLYWNADSTAMPAKVHHFYLDRFYQNNALAKGELVVHGGKVDVADIRIPVYHLASREDHIAPAASVYRAAKLLVNAKNRFVVAGSGHIAGVVNPPALGKYQHWVRDDMDAPDIETWLENAKEVPGSWWPDWDRWLKRRSGKKIPAPTPGAKLGVIEPAPGSYVKVRFDEK
ncbi:class I poly(R)-hydroxyalkanoic acid synthase [Pikeienuella piscinae]|uniref:Class I poly(R)-hydroxyalkanoic acid synthase n=2 Tax=Pikeienuella piscinae TaxID=2748098 RepID=A0A7M3T7F5_9RHOB|nr:class I poly(R)-hydroxyalkanoic acid synthase [Pikeienuella piscinae]